MRKVLILAIGLALAGAACSGSTSSSSPPGSGGSSGTTDAKYPCAKSSQAGTTVPIASNCQALEPVLEFTDNTELPPYFRSMSQTAQNPPANMNVTGLAGMPVSGSANPTASEWAAITGSIGTNTIIVDVRGESHAVLNNDVVAWLDTTPGIDPNKDRSASDSAANESALIAQTQAQSSIVLNSSTPPPTTATASIQSVVSEQQSAQGAGLQYKRLYFDDGEALKDSDVKDLIDLYRGLQPGQQILLHCNNGWDRTTQSLTVFDIITNAPNVSLNDIAARQQTLSVVFNKILDDKRGPLMQRVYAWASANPNGNGDSWATYAKANPPPPSTSGTTQTTA